MKHLNYFSGLLWLALCLCPLEKGYSSEAVDFSLLEKAWQIPTGGAHAKPYYSIELDGHSFPGERSWDARWALMKDAASFKNKRILELGCNVGLASVYLLKYRGAESSVGLDRPDPLLAKEDMPRMIEAAQLIQKAFKVSFPIVQTDVNNSSYEEILGYDYDVVICMSFLKWVQDKERLLHYLAHFDHIIYEGHDPDETEISRFQNYGFEYRILGSTQVGVSYPADATRTMIYFFKPLK